MVVQMIDIELAAKVSTLLIDGEMIDIVLDGVTHSRKLLEHVGTYGLCVQGPTNKLTIPVEMTVLYRKEIEQMARSPAIPGEAPRKVGRPARGPQAPVEHPRAPNTWLPPGSGGVPTLAQEVANAEATFIPPGSQNPPATTTIGRLVERAAEAKRREEAHEVPVQLAEGEIDWIESAMDEMIDDFRTKLSALINGLTPEQPEVAIMPRSVTCFDCEHVDMDGTGSCGKFKMVPPMGVIVDPKAQCPDFTLSIPF